MALSGTLITQFSSVRAQETVSFPTEDGGIVYANTYGHGAHGVMLAHGGRFDKESWAVQARVLAEAGMRVLAIDFRGHGRSQGGPQSTSPYHELHIDVLAAVRYLRCLAYGKHPEGNIVGLMQSDLNAA